MATPGNHHVGECFYHRMRGKRNWLFANVYGFVHLTFITIYSDISQLQDDDLPEERSEIERRPLPGIPADEVMTLVKIRRDSLVHAYAMELFSLFILALAGHIREVKGTTTRLMLHGQTTASNQNGGNGRSEPGKANTTTPRRFENSLFEALAKIAVDTGICPTQEDARLLVIPAFAWYGLLPEPEDPSAMKTDGQSVEDLPNPRTDV